MTSMMDLVNRTRREYFGSSAERINILSSDVAAGGTTLVMELDVSQIQAPVMLSCGLNQWIVRSVNASSKTVTVIPGYGGAPLEAVGAGSIVYVAPRVTDLFLFDKVNDAIREMTTPLNGLYQVGSWESGVNSVYQTYEFPEGVTDLRLLDARIKPASYPDSWYPIPARAIDVDQGNRVLRIRRNLDAAGTVEFRYKAAFTQATSLSDEITDLGMTESMSDIPPIGACAGIAMSNEGRRTQPQTQGDTRRAGEVPVTANTALVGRWADQFRSRCAQELSALLAVDPPWRET